MPIAFILLSMPTRCASRISSGSLGRWSGPTVSSITLSSTGTSLQAGQLQRFDQAAADERRRLPAQLAELVLVEREQPATLAQVDQLERVGLAVRAVGAAVQQRDDRTDQMGAQPAVRPERQQVARHVRREPTQRAQRPS